MFYKDQLNNKNNNKNLLLLSSYYGSAVLSELYAFSVAYCSFQTQPQYCHPSYMHFCHVLFPYPIEKWDLINLCLQYELVLAT